MRFGRRGCQITQPAVPQLLLFSNPATPIEERRPVTSEAAGSSPAHPSFPLAVLARLVEVDPTD
jgi:hypothetical protein